MSSKRLTYFALVFVLGCSTIASLVAVRVSDPFVVSELRQLAFDMLQRAEPRPYEDVPVKIVDIDESSLDQLGQWPWPRDVLAEMVDRLHAVGASAVVFDFLFIEPDRTGTLTESVGGTKISSNDLAFADALSRGNVVLGFGTSAIRKELPPVKAGFAFTGLDPASEIARLQGGASVLPVLAERAAGIGSVNLRKDNSADAVRVVQILWSDGENLYPSLIGEALRIAQGASTYVVNADAEIGGVQSIRVGAFEVPTGPNGELYLYYTPYRADRYVSAGDLFDNQKLSDLAPEIGGKIILIGTSAAGLFDIHKTALGQTVPGIEMHAQAIDQIINQSFLLREDWTRSAELLTLIVACLTVWFTTIFGGARTALIVGAAMSSMIALAAWYSFTELRVLVDYSFPLGGGLAVWFLATAFRYMVTDREKRGIRTAFSRYVHPSVLKQIEENYSKVELGGENCELTVMFTDVRNFTPLSERLEPFEVVDFLNRILGKLSEKVAGEGGVIDKLIGDSVMAFWNAPLRQEDHARRACLASLKMREAVDAMNAEQSFGLPDDVARDWPVEIGVGVNTGPACVGNVGSEERFNYSAIGDAVNIAARAESASKEIGFDLVICASTAAQAPEFAFLNAGSVELKGKTERVPMMALVGDEGLNNSVEFKKLSELHSALIDAIGKGEMSVTQELCEECKSLGAALQPKLVNFFSKMLQRQTDFLDRAVLGTDDPMDADALEIMDARAIGQA